MIDPAGRPPANDLEAEMVVLGMILDSRGSFDVASGILVPEHFYSDQHRAIYAEACEAKRRGATVNYLAVVSGLRDKDMLANVGGEAYIRELAGSTVWTSHLEETCRRVRDKWRVRRLAAECQRIAAESYFDTGPIEEWISASEAAIHAIAQDRNDDTLTNLPSALHSVLSSIINPDQQVRGLSTGLVDLDGILGPLRPGQLILVGALSGVGKSSLALNVAMHTALQHGSKVLVFSAEMEAEELAARALFTHARVDAAKIPRLGAIREDTDDFRRLTAAVEQIGKAAVWIDDRPDINTAQIRATTRRVQASGHGPALGLVIVDYLQLLNGKAGLPKNANREQEVAELSRALKVLAKEAGVPVLALAQLNADSEKAPNGGRKPRMNDLRESKAIAQNSDKIILIHNPHAVERAEQYRHGAAGDEQSAPEMVDLIVAKNRGGRTGTVYAVFDPAATLFRNAERQEVDDYVAALQRNEAPAKERGRSRRGPL